MQATQRASKAHMGIKRKKINLNKKTGRGTQNIQ